MMGDEEDEVCFGGKAAGWLVVVDDGWEGAKVGSIVTQ